MKIFLIVVLGLLATVFPIILVYLSVHWRRLIWENKGRIFKIMQKDDFWLIEKKFLCFFVGIRADGPLYNTKEEAIKDLSEYLKNLYKKQNPEVFIVDYNKFISDPARQIESKKLETKRTTTNPLFSFKRASNR